ncbi:MAG: tetratricopeptide repeat protein [Segetibacter sp.]
MQNLISLYASFLFLFCIGIINSNAQQENTSEENLYITEPGKPDSSKINSLLKYGEKEEETNREKAIKIYERAARLAQSIDYFLGAGKAYNYAGILYSDKGEFEQAIQFNEKAIFFYSKINYKSGMGSAYCNIGNVFKFRGENKEALGYYLKGTALLEEVADSSRLTILYNNIGALFSSLKNNNKAIEYSQKALIIAQKIGSDKNIINACINLSKAYTNEKDTAKAIKVLSESFPIADKIKDYKILNYLHNNLGVIYMYQKKIQPAAYHLNKALESSYKYGNPYDISSTYFSMGVFYKTQKKWLQSEQFCKKALHIADSLQLHDLLAKTYNLLADIEEERGDYKKAYEYYIYFTNYNDSVNSKDQLELMQEMEAKYQSTAKDKALSQKQLLIERSDAAIHNKNNLILFSISGVIIMILLTFLIYFYNRSKRRLASQQIEALKKDRELKVLQAMMDGEERERSRIAGQLHDGIGGMVSAIKMHLGVSKLEYEAIGKSEAYWQAVHLLEDMAKEVRRTSYSLMPEVLHKYGLEETIRLHCQSTSNKTLEVHFQSYNLTKKWSSNAELIIYRIVQELVNNAVKHAACTEILVDISQDEKSMTITVEDNGNGFTQSDQNSKYGMGLSNIQSKAAALEGKIELTTEPGTGTTVTIELPLKNLELA